MRKVMVIFLSLILLAGLGAQAITPEEIVGWWRAYDDYRLEWDAVPATGEPVEAYWIFNKDGTGSLTSLLGSMDYLWSIDGPHSIRFEFDFGPGSRNAYFLGADMMILVDIDPMPKSKIITGIDRLVKRK